MVHLLFSKFNQHYDFSYFAAKVTPKSFKSSTSDLFVLKSIINPYIILIYDYFEDEFYNYMILEYCSKGSLSSIIKSGDLKSQNEKIYYMKKTAEAIHFYHSKGIAHRDIKPNNVLLDDYGLPKLIDFGICEMLYFNPDSISSVDSNDGYYKAGKKGKVKLINKYFGTCSYLTPEIILNEPYDPFAADIWSLGVTFLILQLDLFLGHLNLKKR